MQQRPVARKFRAFITDHLSPAYFRDNTDGAIRPVAKPDVETLLRRAYDLRSAYVHRLAKLPKHLLPPFDLGETTEIEGLPTLTFEGLARLARHVIFEFVARAPKAEREDFNWRSALPNVIQMQLASQHWMFDPDRYEIEHGRFWLQNFLAEISASMLRPGTPLTDLAKILDKIETLCTDNVSADDRRPMLALHELFCRLIPQHNDRPGRKALLKRFGNEFSFPSFEELAIYLASGTKLPWTPDEMRVLHTRYYQQKYKKKALRLGSIFEVIFTLLVAEAYRAAGDDVQARVLISFAVEALPGHGRLRALEQATKSGLAPIDAYEVIAPQQSGPLVA